MNDTSVNILCTTLVLALGGFLLWLRLTGRIQRRPWQVEVVPPYGTVAPDNTSEYPLPLTKDAHFETDEPKALERYTFFLNGDPLCIAQWVDTEDGFWEFSNDEPDEMVMLYAPRPGDTLTSEPGEAF